MGLKQKTVVHKIASAISEQEFLIKLDADVEDGWIPVGGLFVGSTGYYILLFKEITVN